MIKIHFLLGGRKSVRYRRCYIGREFIIYFRATKKKGIFPNFCYLTGCLVGFQDPVTHNTVMKSPHILVVTLLHKENDRHLRKLESSRETTPSIACGVFSHKSTHYRGGSRGGGGPQGFLENGRWIDG